MPSKTLDKSSETIHGLVDMPRQEAIVLLETGYFLMSIGRKKEAQDIFAGTAALFPHSEIPCIALGHLYLSEGKAELAIKEHTRALERMPNSATAQAHLGEALLFHKKIDEGVAALKKAIEMDPHGLSAKLAKELLHANDLQVFGSP